MNSGEPMYSPRECNIKPIDGKIQQDIIHWQSDQPIVARKQGNACGAKGLTVMRWGVRDTFARRRTGEQMRTKLAPLTLRQRKSKM